MGRTCQFLTLGAAALGLLVPLLLIGCEREERQFRTLPASTARTGTERLVNLQPGPVKLTRPPHRGPYDGNALAMSEGQQLYEAYNCVGCHSHGGGGMGPALIDDPWIYGSEPENIFATIAEGRPNGMPSFAGKIPDDQIWKIVAYVRSMGRMVPRAAAPSREDHLYSGESPQASEVAKPVGQAAEHP